MCFLFDFNYICVFAYFEGVATFVTARWCGAGDLEVEKLWSVEVAWAVCIFWSLLSMCLDVHALLRIGADATAFSDLVPAFRNQPISTVAPHGFAPSPHPTAANAPTS